ncbi:MAG: CHRD domain-containing protein [Actinomycetota bacterium]
MRTRPLVMATVVAVWVSAGTAALAHGGHGGHGGGGSPGHGDRPAGAEAPAQHRRGSFSFDLSGAQVPGGGDPKGRASAALRLDPEAEIVCLRSNWRDLAGQVTAIHLHRGPEGETGPHHIDLLDDEQLAGRANAVEFCVQVTAGGEQHAHDADHRAASAPADRIQEVVDNPEGFYLNIHSTAHPDGAVRGQLDS